MDISYLIWLQSLREAAPAAVQGFFSFLGSHVASALMMIVPCLAYWCLDKRRATLALLSYGFSWLSNQLIKNTVCCYRPWVRDARITPDASAIAGASGYSFPSGHTQSAASLLGGLGWAWRGRRWPLVCSLALTLLVGFSRNFLGVHTPQDVVVGLVEGLAFVLVAERLLAWVDEDDRRDARVLAAGLAAVVVFVVYVTLKPYPTDYVDGVLLVDPADMLVDCYKSAGGLAGLLVGWFCERRYVRFETGGLGWRELVLRMVVGVAVVLFAYEVLGHALVRLLGRYVGQLLRHFVAFVLAVAVVPASFPVLARLCPQRKGR